VNEIALPTHEEARALTDRIKIAVEGTWQLIREAYISRTWAVLGYDSWDAYCTDEFGETRLRLPREERQEVVASLRDSGLSVRAIASAVGVNKETVSRDIQVSGNQTPEIQGADGKTYTVTREPEVIDAELVDEPARPEPPKVKRRPLPEAFTDAGRDLTRAAERLARLTEDDRFAKNRETTHHQVPELLGALEHTARLVTAMNLPAAGASEEARRWWATSLHKISDALTDVANSLEKEL
jgi:transposase-like protein